MIFFLCFLDWVFILGGGLLDYIRVVFLIFSRYYSYECIELFFFWFCLVVLLVFILVIIDFFMRLGKIEVLKV